MAYEIDFIGVGSECKQDADAICFRWLDENGKYKIAVYDGGLQAHGEQLEEHLNKYYFDETEKKIIDYVFCSHSDQDHVSGLQRILENFEVKKLYMNRPWLYIKDVWDDVNDGRITEKSFEERLRTAYRYVSDLEKLAIEKGVPIYEAFQGKEIDDRLIVLSPDKEFYLDLLVESDKTPLEKRDEAMNLFEAFAKGLTRFIKNLIETWTDEKLKEDVSTSAENEMSVVLLGKMDEENFLLTGDAGVRALGKAMDYADEIGISIKNNVQFVQIPHHGGRHNVSPSILDRLLGGIVKEGNISGKVAYVSAAKDSDHPLQMVVNAFTRRGARVYKTNGASLWHHRKTAAREGWSDAQKLEFNKEVEDWDD